MPNQSWLELYWNTTWVMILWVTRLGYELFYVLKGTSRSSKFERIKRIGPDLMWISSVIWGIVLVNPNPYCVAHRYLGTSFHPRLLLAVLFAVLISLMLILQRKDTLFGNDILQSRGIVIKRVMIAGALNLLGLLSLLSAVHFSG